MPVRTSSLVLGLIRANISATSRLGTGTLVTCASGQIRDNQNATRRVSSVWCVVLSGVVESVHSGQKRAY